MQSLRAGPRQHVQLVTQRDHLELQYGMPAYTDAQSQDRKGQASQEEGYSRFACNINVVNKIGIFSRDNRIPVDLQRHDSVTTG